MYLHLYLFFTAPPCIEFSKLESDVHHLGYQDDAVWFCLYDRLDSGEQVQSKPGQRSALKAVLVCVKGGSFKKQPTRLVWLKCSIDAHLWSNNFQVVPVW